MRVTISLFSLLFLCLVRPASTFAQLNQLRLSNRVADARIAPPISATRFLTVPNLNGMARWGSSKTVIVIDGVPFRLFPLNHLTPDLLPLDQGVLDSIVLDTHSSVTELSTAPDGAINLMRRKIPDSLSFSLQFFDGSEVGDPLVHFYTRRSMPHYNRNQTGPSAYAVLSNSFDRLRVRASASRYNYFTTGGPQDGIISALDNSDRRNQNRNQIGSVELAYDTPSGDLYSMWTAVSSREGWEMSPFTSTYLRSKSQVSTVRIGVNHLLPGISLSAHVDHLDLQVRPQVGAAGGGYEQTEYGFNAQWNMINGSISRAKLAGNVLFHEVRPSVGGTQFFSRSDGFPQSDIDEIEWGVFGELEQNLSQQLVVGTRLRFDQGISESVFSGQMRLAYDFAEEKELELRAASVAAFPNLLESYASFTMRRQRLSTNTSEIFGVVPSVRLKTARTNEATLSLSRKPVDDNVTWSVGFFVQSVDSPIEQRVIKSFRAANPGDIVRLAEYTNGRDYTTGGFEVDGTLRLSDGISVAGGYRCLENSSIPFSARHVARANVTIRFESQTSVMIGARATSRQRWEEFRLSPTDDELYGLGFDGIVSPQVSVDLFIQQQLGEFFSLPLLTVQAEARNLFNTPLKLLPIGTHLGTIFLFSVKATL